MTLKLIKNAVVAHGEQAGITADVLIDGDRIADIQQQIQAPDAAVIDATGLLLTPGFVDGHRHFWQTPLRGQLANRVLADYYRRVRVGFATVYTPEDVYVGILSGAIDAVMNGVTTVLDHCHIMNSPAHADAAISALKDAGIRALLCYGFYESPVDPPGFKSKNDRFQDLGRIRRDLIPSDSGLLSLGVALTEHWLVPAEVTKAEIEAARCTGVDRITLHVGSNPAPTDLQRYRKTGCFGSDITYSHCNSCESAFFDFVQATGGGIVATPETEMGMGMGFPVTNQAIAKGIPFGLGVDIVSFANGDMLTAARLALQTARLKYSLPDMMAGRMAENSGFTTSDALHWITNGGAAAIGKDHLIGMLQPGKKADLVLLKADGMHMNPMPEPATAVVLHASAHDVDTVLIDGHVRVLHGKAQDVDIQTLKQRVNRSRQNILERIRQADTSQATTSQIYESLIRGTT